MYIYLKKDKDLEEIVETSKCDGTNNLWDWIIFDYKMGPYVVQHNVQFDVLKKSGIEKFFFKATDTAFPKYCSSNRRQYGIYHFGDAKGELLPGKEILHYSLKLETNTFQGILDMQKLQQELWAGRITPTIPYDRPQRKFHILSVLREILSTRKLSALQRFFLALRLSKG